MKIHTFFLTSMLSASFLVGVNYAVLAANTDNHEAVHNDRGRVVKNSFDNCVRTGWASESDECNPPPPPKPKVEHRLIAEDERTVYFEFNKITLMKSEQTKLDSLVGKLKSMNDIIGVSIVGYADRIGTPSYNEQLSKQRAQTVEKYMRKRGYINTSIAKTRWLGETAPVTQCPDSLSRKELVSCLQKDRRVTVEIKYQE